MANNLTPAKIKDTMESNDIELQRVTYLREEALKDILVLEDKLKDMVVLKDAEGKDKPLPEQSYEYRETKTVIDLLKDEVFKMETVIFNLKSKQITNQHELTWTEALIDTKGKSRRQGESVIIIPR